MNRTDNLLAWYGWAEPRHLEDGLAWYREAADTAERIVSATGGEVTHRQACGVLAVLSPRCSWPDNRVAALQVVLAWRQGIPAHRVNPPGVLGANVPKAYRILQDPDFGVCDGTRIGARGQTVQCKPAASGCRCPLHGPKVAAFFRAITGTADDGAMDVWAIRAATVRPTGYLAPDDPRRHPNVTPAQYAEIAAAYRQAAVIAGISPRQFQAVIWLTIRDNWTRADGRIQGRRNVADDLFREVAA